MSNIFKSLLLVSYLFCVSCSETEVAELVPFSSNPTPDKTAGWIRGESDEEIRIRAAGAYSKYQKISLRSAKRLLVTGW